MCTCGFSSLQKAAVEGAPGSAEGVDKGEWSDAIVQAMMPAYNKEERKYRCGSVKRSTGRFLSLYYMSDRDLLSM